MSRITIIRTHNAHRDYRKSSPTFVKQYSAGDGFVIERAEGGAFRITHKDAPKVVGLGPAEVIDWEEEAFLPQLAATAGEKRSREKVA